MLFLTYWELNENSKVADRMQAAQSLIQSGMHEPDGVTILRWDITPDNWGILVVEADSNEAIARTMGTWRAAFPGMFKTTKTAPALPISEAMPQAAEILAELQDM